MVPRADRATARRPRWARHLVGGGLAGLTLATFLLAILVQPPLAAVTGSVWDGAPSPAMIVLVLAMAVVVGGLGRLPVASDSDSPASVSFAIPFVVALAVLGPLSIALLGSGLAITIDGLRRRNSLHRTGLALSCTLLAVLVMRTTYVAFAGEGLGAVFGSFTPFVPTLQGFVAAVVASAAFVLTSHCAEAAATALSTGQRVLPGFVQDLGAPALTAGGLAMLGPVVALSIEAQPLMIALLVAPVVALYFGAGLTVAKRGQSGPDPLTGLTTRSMFREQVAVALHEGGGQPLVVMVIELDNVKGITQTLGHQVRDELVAEVARRLDDARPADSTVAHLGGEEFALLLPDVPEVAVAEDIATYLLSVLNQSFRVAGSRLLVAASLGISMAPDDGNDVDSLIKRAGIAQYEANKTGVRFGVFSDEISDGSQPRLGIQADLVTALDNDELFIEYLPKIDLATGELSGVEALVRWNHPAHGMIGPDDFIPWAEQAGLIAPITWFVVENCLEQMQKWRADGLDLDVAINLSGKHLSDLDLPDRFAVALERWGVPPAQLLIEVAETSILTDPRRAASVLSQLRRIGIGVAIDDYGTGSSTPSWLERLEADELKIDRSFMRLDRTSSDAVIVASAVELGHQLGLRVVAEGVEDAATLTWLRGLGCDLAQGFQISRPIDADSVVLLAQRVAVAAGSPPPGVLRLVGSGG